MRNLPRKQRLQHVKRRFKGRAILLIRNPFRSISSYWQYFHSRRNAKIDFSGDDFELFAFRAASRFVELIDDWSEFGDEREMTVVYYEDLIEKPIEEIERVVRRLNLVTSYPNNRLLQQVTKLTLVAN